MFDQILDLISQPPGSLAYHFVILFAVEAALAMGIGQWLRESTPGTARLTVGILTIFTARVLLLVASLVAFSGFVPLNVLIPPVERAADTITILAAAWLIITMDDPDILRRNLTPDVVAGVLVGMTIAGFIGTYYFWFFAASQGELFNESWLDTLWVTMQVIFALIGLIWMLMRVRYVFDPVLKGALLVVLGASSALHIINPPPGDVASAIHVGQLIAMPMLAAVAYRHVVEKLLHWDAFEPSRELPAVSVAAVALPVEAAPQLSAPPAAAPASAKEDTLAAQKARTSSQPALLEVIEALSGLLGSLEQSEVVNGATRAVATALRADICVLAVVDEETQEAGVLGGYDNIAQSYLPQAVLDLGVHTSIVNALGRLRQMRLTVQRNQRELKDLFSRLGISHQGPAYVQPLVDNDDRIGVLIVASPYSERQLSNEERNLLDRLAPLVTGGLLNAERYQKAQQEGEEIMAEEGARLASLSDGLTATTAELNDARRQMDEMKAYIRDMHRQLEAARAQQTEIEKLREEIERVKGSSSAVSNGPIISSAQDEIRRLREDNERLLQRILQQNHDADRSFQQAAPPAHGNSGAAERGDVQKELEEMRSTLQAELVSLRGRVMQASISQQEVSFLQEQLSIKARETVGLQARLTEAQAVAEALREQIASSRSGTQGLEALQARIATQANEIAALQSRLEAARAEPEAIRAQQEMDRRDEESTGTFQAIQADRSEMIQTLEAQLSEKNRAIAELRAYMADVENSLRNLERQLSHKTEEVAALQGSLAEARAQAEQRMAALETGKAGKGQVDRAQVETLEARLAEKAKAVDVLESQLENARQSIGRFEEQLSATHDAVDAAITDARQGDSHDEVIASIAQEIRTPMSSIMGYTELLLRESVGILGSLQRKFLQRVKANTERMGVLLEDLIRITALDTGRMQLEPQKVDVVYAIEETIMNVTNQYREKGLTLRLTLAEGLPPLTADRDALLQIFGHLLTNAALASPVEGEVELTASVQRETLKPQDGDEVQANCLSIAVEDSGGGVAEEDYDRVFMRKYRADNPLIEGLGDTGVSLSLAKALVDAHGGRIWLDSHTGKGTTFHIVLPLKPLDGGVKPVASGSEA